MIEIYCFDIGAVLILVTMLVTMFLRKMTKGRLNLIFIQLISVTLLGGIYDIASSLVNGNPNVPEVVKYFVTGGYYVCEAIGFFLYARYILDLSDTRHIFRKKWYRFIARPPVIIAFACTIITYFTHICYFYSSKGYYIRGKGNIIFYVICGGYALFAILATFKNLKYFGVTRSLSLVSVAFVSLITAYIQYLYPYVVVTVLGFTVSLLFIMLFISNPEEKADSVSGLKNYRAYLNDVNRAYDIGKPLSVIFITILNLNALEDMLSFENFMTLCRTLGAKIDNICEEYKVQAKAQADIYYLREGRFRILMLDGVVKDEVVLEMSHKLLDELNCEIVINETTLNIESNICLSKSWDDFATADELYNFGGLWDKEKKRDEVVFATDLLETAEYDMITKLDEIMERAILNNSFDVYFQPIYSVKEKKFTHAEALLRLFDYEFGLIDTESIISAAEVNGTIHRIGKIVMEETCRYIASDEFKRSSLVAVAVNISIIQLMQKNFADEYISIMQNYGVRSDQIIFEITESEAAENQKSVIENIETIAKYGTKFSLNNYGTGYSNITTTSALPLASSKLDRTLINSEYNEKLEVIIENSIALLKSLGRSVVVVGVETEDMFRKYEEAGVDYIQGYYFSRPLKREDFVYFIEHNNNNVT